MISGVVVVVVAIHQLKAKNRFRQKISYNALVTSLLNHYTLTPQTVFYLFCIIYTSSSHRTFTPPIATDKPPIHTATTSQAQKVYIRLTVEGKSI
jgi:hypothetical protein